MCPVYALLFVVVLTTAHQQGVQAKPRQGTALAFLQKILQNYLEEQETVQQEFDGGDYLEDVSDQGDDCDCCYSSGGCKVCKTPPKNKACRCSYKGFWSCGGSIANCRDSNNYFCKNPDKSYFTCLQGGGDCDAYRKLDDCDCQYDDMYAGCQISKPPPKGYACSCKMDGSKCSGSVRRCTDTNSDKCKNPDKSSQTCKLGGGNCDGYKEVRNANPCNCKKEYVLDLLNIVPAGCAISELPPKGTACKCQRISHFKCVGELITCSDLDSNKCKNPDKSYETCLQGGGDCLGYREPYHCDCEYKTHLKNERIRYKKAGGCVISVPPPKEYSCTCKRDSFTTCTGEINKCKDGFRFPHQGDKCMSPDKSFEACKLGRGDCFGYKESSYYGYG